MLTHKPDCTKPVEYPVVGRYGDPLVRCRCCHAFAVADAPTRPVEPSAAPKPAPVPAEPVAARVQPVEARTASATRYACVEHLAPVNWRGTGCQDCDADRRERQARRAAERRRRRETAAERLATR